MNANLFTWIREGVKQSVLLGVTDAVEALGVPDNDDDIRPRLMEFMQQDDGGGKGRSVSVTPRRKRLGRTLKDMEADTGK